MTSKAAYLIGIEVTGAKQREDLAQLVEQRSDLWPVSSSGRDLVRAASDISAGGQEPVPIAQVGTEETQPVKSVIVLLPGE